MGVRGPGAKITRCVLEGTVESPGCSDPVSPTVAPYAPSLVLRLDDLAVWVGLRRHDRSLVNTPPGQERPDDPSHLVGQGDDDQHLGLARQHLG